MLNQDMHNYAEKSQADLRDLLRLLLLLRYLIVGETSLRLFDLHAVIHVCMDVCSLVTMRRLDLVQKDDCAQNNCIHKSWDNVPKNGGCIFTEWMLRHPRLRKCGQRKALY